MRSLKEVKMSKLNDMFTTAKVDISPLKTPKVTYKECMEAIDYFFKEGFIDELGTDKKYYTKILLNKVARGYNINLDWGDSDE